MSRYVDKEKLLKVIAENSYILSDAYNSRSYGMFTQGIEQAVDECIIDNVAEVKHGKWMERSDNISYEPHYVCSNCKEEYFLLCGTPETNNYNYCPNCGARMDGETK